MIEVHISLKKEMPLEVKVQLKPIALTVNVPTAALETP
jgi:hypothetical protein